MLGEIFLSLKCCDSCSFHLNPTCYHQVIIDKCYTITSHLFIHPHQGMNGSVHVTGFASPESILRVSFAIQSLGKNSSMGFKTDSLPGFGKSYKMCFLNAQLKYHIIICIYNTITLVKSYLTSWL